MFLIRKGERPRPICRQCRKLHGRRQRPKHRGFLGKPYLSWLHSLPCAVAIDPSSPCSGPITAHHVRRYGERRQHGRAVPLCAGHHLRDWGKDSIERLGRLGFQRRFGIDLEALILRLNKTWQLLNQRAA